MLDPELCREGSVEAAEAADTKQEVTKAEVDNATANVTVIKEDRNM